MAQQLGGDVSAADRAALLAKADLGSNMVGEFPELQGIMGAYYAAGDGEPASVVEALRTQYRNRCDAPVNADTLTAATLFIAERAETLVGIWAIGLAPTGERDPFGLRRAALGLISAFEQLAAGGWLKINQDGPLSLDDLLDLAAGTFPAGKIPADTLAEVRAFIYERYRNQLIADSDRNAVEAVIALTPPLHQVGERVRVAAFAQMPEAASLAAANKRIGNLLKKAEGEIGQVNDAALVEPAERRWPPRSRRCARRPRRSSRPATSPPACARWPRRASRWTPSSPTSWSWPRTRPCAPTGWPCWASCMA